MYGQSSPPEIDISNIEHVPISMFVGKEDQIIDLESNRWVKEQLKDHLHYYEELDEFDHFSFQLASDMSYFDRVIEQVMYFNPVSDDLRKYTEKRRKQVLENDKKNLQKNIDSIKSNYFDENFEEAIMEQASS